MQRRHGIFCLGVVWVNCVVFELPKAPELDDRVSILECLDSIELCGKMFFCSAFCCCLGPFDPFGSFQGASCCTMLVSVEGDTFLV